MKAVVNDVVQLNPEHSYGWGPLLCIVDEVHGWGIRCYALVPVKRWEAPNLMYLRVNHENYVIVGKVEWVCSDEGFRST